MDHLKCTPLEAVDAQLYLKRESQQHTHSFKPWGVGHAVQRVLEGLVDTDPDRTVYLVTQSTGNHAVAMLRSLAWLWPSFASTKRGPWRRLRPVVFGTCWIRPDKKRLAKEAFAAYTTVNADAEWTEAEGLLYDAATYAEALRARERFVDTETPNAIYISHGGAATLDGYRRLGTVIDRQLTERGVQGPVDFFAACGAGGPIGIGAALVDARPGSRVFAVQNEGQNAFVRSLFSGQLEHNPPNEGVGRPFADGIAVDRPEATALSLARSIGVFGITVAEADCSYGSEAEAETTRIALAAARQHQRAQRQSTLANPIVVLDCERRGDV